MLNFQIGAFRALKYFCLGVGSVERTKRTDLVHVLLALLLELCVVGRGTSRCAASLDDEHLDHVLA